MDRLPPPASSFPIRSKAEASAAFTGNQAKSSNKGVFTPFLRSAKWISVLLYFKISHFLQKLTQHILLARKMWRRRWEARRLSQRGSPLSGSISRCIPSPATPTHISTCIGLLQHGFSRMFSLASCTSFQIHFSASLSSPSPTVN